MNNLENILKKYKIKPYKYKYINKACIIYTKDKMYVVKEKNKDIDSIYNYLLSRDFNNFLYPVDILDKYVIYDYISDKDTNDDLKANDLMKVMADLHNKTTTYTKINLDNIKEIYEDKQNNIDLLFKYYNNLEEVFMLKVYNSPEEYLLQRNFDKIYNTLEYAKNLCNKWYDTITKNPNIRKTLTNNHLSLEHFINKRIINFNYAKYDIPIYDFIYFYKKHYMDLDINDLYNVYKHKFLFTKEEELLLFLELIVPDKISFINNHYINTLNVYKLINYMDKTREFILKQQEKDKERYNTEENKQDNSI